MKKPDIAKNEKERLEELDTYNIIGAEENDEYDFITSMAAQICDTKIALISLVTEDKQWFLSHHGLQARETSKDYSFCAHAINTPDQPFVIEDARIDERFFDNPLTTGDPHVIFYAGIPMVSENGLPLGSMCVIDDSPKKLSESQMNQLKKLSIQAVRLLELRRSNKKLLDLTNNINESSLISITDEKGTITEINKLFCELSGYTEAELVGQNHRIINSGYHDKQFWLDMWKTIAKGEIWRGEIKNRAKDGSEYWVASVITPVKDRSGKIRQYISIRQDITERKTIEIENEALTKRLNYALDASGDGIWDWTPANGQTVYSKAWLEMLGYEVGELTSLTSEWSDRLHPDDAEWVFAAINKVTQTAENGDTFSHEYRFRNKSDDYLWILNKAKVVERNEKGEASRVVGAHTNITERKEAEMLLLNSENRFRTIVNNAPFCIHEISLEGNLLSMNPAGLQMMGVEKIEQIVGTAYLDAVCSIDRPRIEGLMQEAKQNEFRQFEFVAPEGNVFKSNFVPLYDEFGTVDRLMGITEDITERKEAEIGLARSNQLLEESQAVAKLGGWELDLLTGELYWTAETYRIHDTSPEEFNPTVDAGVGYFLPESKRQISEALELAITKGIGYDLYLETYTTKGRKIDVRTTCEVTVVDGKPTKLTGIFQDITERKKVEIKILESEAKFKNSFEASPIPFALNDSDGNITNLNTAFIQTFGYNLSDIPTLNDWWPLAYPDINYRHWVASEWKKRLDNMLPNNSVFEPIELNICCKDGSTKVVLSSAAFLEKSSQGLHQVILVDITDRKQAEKIIKKSEADLKEAQSMAKLGRWDLNLITSQLHWSDSVFEIFEINKEKFGATYEVFLNTIHPDDRQLVNDAYTRSIETKQPYEIEHRLQMADGRIKWVKESCKTDYDENGTALRSVGIVQDITEQKKAQIELQLSNARLSIATESAKIGIWDYNIEDNNLVWDDQIFALFGVSKDSFSVNNEGWRSILHPEDVQYSEQAVEDAINNKKGLNIEYRVIWPNKSIHHIGAFGKIVLDNNGKAIKLIGVNYDVTERVQKELELIQAKEKAEAASKAKSEFLANMSHEIRTPLNGVIGFTDLLTSTPLSPVQQQYANSANVSGHTLLAIINDILDFSKIEAGMLELEVMKTDMVELLENSIDIIKFSTADKELELLLDIDPSMPRFAHIDSIRTKQILANLLSNAIKFTQKGEVALKAVYQALDGKKGKLSISVRDTGIGITEDQKEKLFKSFSQADSSTTRKFGGTGLGLIISQMIAEKMGSKINLDSTPDVSTTFSFDIFTNFEDGEKLDNTHISGVKRCLIIDDNDNNRLILEQMLKQWNIESDSCTNGFEAIKKLEIAQPYDVIICDYDMPYLNGIDTIRLMKDKLKLSIEKQAVILLHSSIDNTELNQKCKELGVRFHLTKPVKSQDLFNYLSHLDQTTETIAKQETEQTVNASHTSEKIKILIAEDNPLNMELSKTILSQLMPNSEVYEARNGLEAIEQYKSIFPDLIFMDVHMPELDGIEATKQIRVMEVQTRKHVPIIALTAGALKVEKDKCLAAGMDEFLTKPLESTKIKTVLNKFFQQEIKVNADLQNLDDKNEIHFGYSKLAVIVGNDIEMAKKLISMFITTMPTKIDQLEKACNEIDLATIKAIAHSIKGNCLNMRCSILADISEKIEKTTQANSVENVEILLKELKEEWEIVKTLLLNRMDL